MTSLILVSNSNFPIPPENQQENSIKGFSIGKVAKIAFYALAAAFALVIAAAIVASVVTGVLPLTVLVVSSVALGILVTAKIIQLVKPYLPEKMQRVINAIRATVVDLFSLLALVVMFPVKQSWFDPKEKNSDQTPILLVHGYLHNSSGWAYHRYQYKKAGFDNVYTVDLGHPFHSIEEYSQVLSEKIKEIKKITGCSDIRLVGHSMGGVVSAHYALNHATDDRIEVKDLITLGSPLKGTHVARIGVGKCARQMQCSSEFIDGLSQQISASAIPHLYQGSQADIIILPNASALNNADEDDENTLIHSDLGHVSYLFSDRVIRANLQRFRQSEEMV